MNTRWVIVGLCFIAAMGVKAEPYQTQRFTVTLPDVTLYGNLEQPLTTGQTPMAIIIAGSGPTDRDGNSKMMLGKNDSLRLLGEGLASEGIATIRFDKRGVGESQMTGLDESKMRFETFVNDVNALIAEAKRKGFNRIFLIGHSEGALIASLAAKQNTVQGVVLLCAAGRPIDVILDEQLQRSSPQLAQQAKKIMQELKQGRLVANVPAALSSLFRPSVQPYIQSWLRYDPAVIASEMPNKVLSISGGSDIQVTLADAEALALTPNIQSTRIEHMNHVLKMVASRDPAEQQEAYTNPNFPLASELVPRIRGFILEGESRE